jgi:hypothetical protein
MQRGKCWERVGILAAEMTEGPRASEEVEEANAGVEKWVERWFKIGVRRSSSSRRGRARDVN